MRSVRLGATRGLTSSRRVTGQRGLAVNVLALVGAVLLVLSALIHLHLWSQGYRNIPTIGDLFIVQGVAAILVAVAVAVLRRFIVLAAGALFAIGTIAGLLWSIWFGLFAFRESIHAPYVVSSLVVEGVAFVALTVAASLAFLPNSSK